MDRLIRKINTSPKVRQKYGSERSKQFGVPLKQLVDSSTGDLVPPVVCNICECILENGLSLQGIFRVNGGVRLIDNLKRSLQRPLTCRLNVTEAAELYALAGVLKLFLRELPGGLISKEHTIQFVQIVNQLEEKEAVDTARLETLVNQLPEENTHLLNYLCRFLATVAKNECENRMSAQSLGILFGPCVFRFDFTAQGLRLQASVNQVMTALIQHHADIFRRFSAPIEPQVTCPRPDLWKSTFASFSDDELPSSLRTNSLSITSSTGKGFFSTLFSDRSSDVYTSSRLELLPSIESALLDLPSYTSLGPQPSLLRTSFAKSDCMNWSHHESVSWLPSCVPSDPASLSVEPDDTAMPLQNQPLNPLSTVDFVLQTSRDNYQASSAPEPECKSRPSGSGVSEPYEQAMEFNLPSSSEAPKRQSLDKLSTSGRCTNPVSNSPIYSRKFMAIPKANVSLLDHVLCRTFSLPSSKMHKKSYQPRLHTLPSKPKVPLSDFLYSREQTEGLRFAGHAPISGILPSSPLSHENKEPSAHDPQDYSQVMHYPTNVDDAAPLSIGLPLEKANILSHKRVEGRRSEEKRFMSSMTRPKSMELFTGTAQYHKYFEERAQSAPQLTGDYQTSMIRETKQNQTSSARLLCENVRSLQRDTVDSSETPQCLTSHFGLCDSPPPPIQDVDASSVSQNRTASVLESEAVSKASTSNAVSLPSLQSFNELFNAVLEEQRRRCGRPENLSLMNTDQIQQEKVDLQKGLLYFERLHGRPQDAESKRVMRPLYERYRQVKRLLRAVGVDHTINENKSSYPDRSLSISANQISPSIFAQLGTPTSYRIDPTVRLQSERLTSNQGSSVPVPCDTSPRLPKGECGFVGAHKTAVSVGTTCESLEPFTEPVYRWPILDASPTVEEEELLAEHERLTKRKRELQRELRAFEKSLSIETGHPPTKSERAPLREKYHEYHSLKQSLQLLSERLQINPPGVKPCDTDDLEKVTSG